MGKNEEALATVQKLQQIAEDRRVWLRPSGRIYARMGKRREGLEIIQKLEADYNTAGGNSFALTAIYSALGDRDHAIASLEQGVQPARSYPSCLPTHNLTRCARIPASNNCFGASAFHPRLSQ